MTNIKEPKEVDFIIQSPPLTNQEQKEISEFIKKCKKEIRKKVLDKDLKTEKTKS